MEQDQISQSETNNLGSDCDGSLSVSNIAICTKKDWNLYKVLKSAHEAKVFFEEESFWKIRNKFKLLNCDKTIY